MNTATKSNYDQKRAKLIKLAHIAANELGLISQGPGSGVKGQGMEDEYHLILRRWNRPGTRQPVTSSLQMSTAQLDELLLFFKGLGFKVKRKSGDADKRESGTSASTHQRMYASSLTGLKDEICDLAKKRWGQGSSSQGSETSGPRTQDPEPCTSEVPF